MNTLSPLELASRLDAVLCKPAATAGEIEALCTVASAHKFRAVCVNSSRVELACARLEDSGVQVVALVSFPFGAMDADAKRYETELAVDHGAQEIEVLLNLGLLKDGASKQILRELRDVVEAADERPVCAVLGTTQMTREEITLACKLILDSGAKAVCTGTAFWPDSPVSESDVKLLRESVGAEFEVKVADGIRDVQTALTLLGAGATRIGTTDAFSLGQSLQPPAG